MRRSGIFRWTLPGEEPVPSETSVRELTAPPPGISGAARTTWTARHLWTYSYEAAQPPLFYLLAVPFWIFGSAAGGPLGGVLAVRLLDAMLVAALAPLAAAASLLVSPSPPRAAASALVAVTVPGLLLNATAVTNDALVAALGGLLTVLLLFGVRRGWTAPRAALVGAVFGAALLTKLTAAGLAVGLAGAFAWPLLAGRAGLRACLRPALIAGVAAAAVVAPWLVLNAVLYRHAVATAEANRLLGSFFGPMILTPHSVAASFKNGFATFWTGEPRDTLPIVRPVSGLALLWCLVAAVGIQRLVRAPGSRAAAALVTVISLGTGVWAFTAMLLSQIGGLMPGRYAYPALVATAVVLVQGGSAALCGPRTRPLAAAALAAWAGLCLAAVGAYAAGLTAAHHPGSLVPPAGRPRPVAASAAQGPVALSVDGVLAEPARQRLYVHLRVRNEGGSEMEWWPLAVARFPGQAPLLSSYAEGTALPPQLEPGTAAEGWVVFDLVPPAEAGAGFQIGFLGIAGHGYRSYGDLVVGVPGG